MNTVHLISCGCLLLVAVLVDIAQPTCVLESDFGFKINCAFKKAGLFRVRNLGGIKAHASLGFSLGDELGFEQSLTNLDPSRRRSVNVNNGIPPNLVAQSTPRSAVKQEKRGKQNRIMMRPPAPINRPNKSAMDRLSSLHRRVSSTMQPIVVGPTIESPTALNRINPSVTVAKPMPMGVPPFKPLPPKEDTLKVLPITATTKKAFTPLQLPQSKGPGLAYQSESYPHVNHDQVSKMVSQMTASHVAPTQLLRITPTSIIVNTPRVFTVPTTINPFIPMPVAAPPTQAINIIPAPVLKDSVLIPLAPSMLSKTPTAYSLAQNTLAIQKTNPNSDFLDPVPHQVHDLANFFNTKKIDDYNSITGYGDEVTLNFKKEDINAKIAEIAKAGNISMEAVEAAIALRQQQLLSKYANIPIPTTTTTTSTTTTTTEEPALIFQAEPEPEIIVASVAQKPKRNQPSGKVMNAPREYYPVGYEKDFDDHFQSKVDLPGTNFHCGDQKYFPGLYGDENLGCMVFHVCALTDDGLVMKSFLCPESTLFDQTILKCNWWFYVDCKNTRRLYDTNIPVSKSYQLMKALTFFSSYKKEMQDDGDRSTNPEDVEGIKEAISILENQNTPQQTATNTDTNNEPNAIQIITPKPVIDERHNNHRLDANDTSPIYRGNRDYKNVTNTNTEIKKISARFRSNQQTKVKSQEQPNSELRLVTLNAGFNVNDDKKSNSAENRKVPLESTTEKRHKRKMTLKSSNVTTTTINPTTKQSVLRESVEANDFKSNTTEIKQEMLTDQVENLGKIDAKVLKEAENSPPIKRFYRSSAEIKNDNKEIAMVNNQKVQIVRPTSYAKLVGEYQTPTATISKLDEAILGRPVSRFKKEVIIITPEKLDRSRDT